MVQWLPFEKALERSQRMKRNLLLGNGFSVSASPSFMYKSLFSETDFNNIQPAKKLFEYFKTYDFEKIIRHLDISSKVSSVVGDNEFSGFLFNLKKTLIDRFVNTIVRIHPTNLHQKTGRAVITSSNFSQNNNFLKHFIRDDGGKIFTLNYDLLLYWSILEGLKNKIFSVADGFSYNSFRSDHYATNIFYLHGALHLKTNDLGETHKLKHAEDDGLLSQTASNIMNNRYPLIVFEGTCNDKEKRIKNNRYLSMCREKLSSIQGVMFTYGVSFSANDFHIVEAILSSQISNVCIGVYLDFGKQLPNTDKSLRLAISLFEDKHKAVYLYSTKNMRIW